MARLFQSFRMAVGPTKMVLAMLTVIVVCLVGWVMDICTEAGAGGGEDQAILAPVILSVVDFGKAAQFEVYITEPAKTIRADYALEYGTDTLEIHKDAVKPGMRLLLLDDLLATGGTIAATAKLVERLGGRIVGIRFLIELAFLNGREKLEGYDVGAVMRI